MHDFQNRTPRFAAFVVALSTTFCFAGCSSSGEPEGAAGTGGGASGANGTAGSTSGTAGSATGGGAGAGGSSAGTASSAGSGGSTGGAGAGSGGNAGTTSSAGTAGSGTSGAGGSTGGAGSGGSGGLALGGAGAGGAGGAAGGATAGTGGSGGGGEDLDIQADQFSCIADWDQVLGFRINNLLGHLPEAIAVAERGTGVYPVGTIIQHLPTEAMVKRRAGFSPETKDWEFFLLQLSPQGETTIVQRGTTEIETSMGDTCVSCHSLAPDEYDFVCNTYGDAGGDHCGFDFMDSFLNQQLMSDTRCD